MGEIQSNNSTRLLLALVAVALVVAMVVLVGPWMRRQPHDQVAKSAPLSQPEPPDTRDSTGESVELRQEVADDVAPVVVAKNGIEIHGLVVDTDGTPRAAVGIVQRVMLKDVLVARSGEDGKFTSKIARLEGQLVAARGAWATVVPCKLMAGREKQELVLVVSPSIEVSGIVVDVRDHAVSRATVGVRMSTEAKSRLPATLDVPSDILLSTSTDDGGKFGLRSLPVVRGSRLLASCEPLLPVGADAPTSSTAGLRLVLLDPVDALLLEGVVLEANGAPASFAQVSLSHDDVRTRHDGGFRMALKYSSVRQLDPATPLIAKSSDSNRTVLREEFGRVVLEARDNHTPPAPVTLTFGAEDRTITGHVVEANGQPLDKQDPSVLEHEGEVSVVNGTVIERAERWNVTLEQPSQLDINSAFELRGLRDRDYVLECTLPSRKMRFRSAPIHAGAEDVVLRVPADAFLASLRGRVVAPDGTGIPNASLKVRFKDTLWSLGGTSDHGVHVTEAASDANGGFELHDVPRHCAWLVVAADSIEERVLELDQVDLSSDLRVVVRRMTHVEFGGLDETLEWISVECLDLDAPNDGVHQCGVWGMQQGSGGAVVGEGRRTIALKSNGKDLLRCDVELVVGKRLVLRP